jgi:hypothetical protein
MLKIIINIFTFSIVLFAMDTSMYNCVDCEYSKTDIDRNMVYNELVPYIMYQEPKKVKLYIQNFNCDNCKMFEVSVRKEMKKFNEKNKK